MERRLLVTAFVLHVAVTLFVALHHEAWRDEADPWLLMRDGDAASIVRAAANRGVPLLFELTVWPFARAGVPYVAQQLLNLVYVWGAVALILRSRAFATPVKILFAFSYYPAFEYAVIARPYGLQMLLTFAMADAWRARYDRPVRIGLFIALLANTTTLGLMTAAVAGLLLLWERVPWRGLAVAVAGGLIAVAQLWPREGRQQVYSAVQLDTVWFAVASMVFPSMRIEDAIGGALVILGILVYGISRRWTAVVFLAATMTALLLIYVFIWMGGLRHAGILLVVALAAVMIADAYGPYRRERLLMAALAVSLAYSLLPAWNAWVAETKYAFSGSREAAAYIRKAGLDRNAVLVSHTLLWSSPLAYLPDAKIWYPARGRFGTFSRWERSDEELARMPLEAVLERARMQFRGRRWVFIGNTELPAPLRREYRLIYRTSEPIWSRLEEQYWIYEPAVRP